MQEVAYGVNEGMEALECEDDELQPAAGETNWHN